MEDLEDLCGVVKNPLCEYEYSKHCPHATKRGHKCTLLTDTQFQKENGERKGCPFFQTGDDAHR